MLPATLQAMQVLLPLRRPAGRPPSQLHAMLDRGLLKLAKTVADVLNAHPWCVYGPSAAVLVERPACGMRPTLPSTIEMWVQDLTILTQAATHDTHLHMQC